MTFVVTDIMDTYCITGRNILLVKNLNLRMSQISRKVDHLRSNYCVLARVVNNLGFAGSH